jgi:hypothetical protein
LVALGEDDSGLILVDRRRLPLIDPGEATWAKQPYHAAHGLDPQDAEAVVERATRGAHAHAHEALREARAAAESSGHEPVGCAVLSGAGMPAWTVAEILSVHLRMHQAEGELFREALRAGARQLGLRVIGIREKQLEARAKEELSLSAARVDERLRALGKQAGPPWARDQKGAALAAWIALRSLAR